MSETSSEKLVGDNTSLDEDSGHDSVDDVSCERERIACLENAVSWIKEEVVQLKSYDKEILQDLWRIRNTIHGIRDTHKKFCLEESKFLDEMEEKPSTPDPQQHVITQLDQKHNEENDRNSCDSFSPRHPVSNCSSPTLPQSPKYTNSEGEIYRTGTLMLMATAPKHLKKPSDDKLLEEFFGSDQLDKMDIFKSKDNQTIGQSGVEEPPMPNTSNTPSSVYSDGSHHNQIHDGHTKQGSPATQTKPRIPINPNKHGANRLSCNVVAEMEKLWEQLHETTVRELAEFDWKFSPKLHHDVIENGRSRDQPSNHHRYHGSLDSTIPPQLTVAVTSPNQLKSKIRHGHSRQASLPIDPVYFRRIQQELSNENSPPQLYVRRTASGNVCEQQKTFGSAHQLSSNNRSNTPPVQYGHVRQVSGSSLSSAGSGTFSPPMVLGNIFKVPDGLRDSDREIFVSASQPTGGEFQRALGQFNHGCGKQSTSPGQSNSRISPSLLLPSPASSQSSSGGVSPYNSRYSPEGKGKKNGLAQSFGGNQLHYSTNAIRRKKTSYDFSADPHLHHHYQQLQQLQQQQLQQQQLQQRKPVRITPVNLRSYSFEEKQMSAKPPVYERHGEAKSEAPQLHQAPRGKQLRDRSSSEIQLSHIPFAYRQQLPQQQLERTKSIAMPDRSPKKGAKLITSIKQTWI